MTEVISYTSKSILGEIVGVQFSSVQLSGQMVADESGHGQKGTLRGSSVHMKEPDSSGVKILLSPMSSHLSLAQGENDSQGGDLAGDSVSGRVMPVRLDPEVLDSDPVNHGGLLSETSSELLEAGKEGWAREVLGGKKGGYLKVGRLLILLRLKPRCK